MADVDEIIQRLNMVKRISDISGSECVGCHFESVSETNALRYLLFRGI